MAGTHVSSRGWRAPERLAEDGGHSRVKPRMAGTRVLSRRWQALACLGGWRALACQVEDGGHSRVEPKMAGTRLYDAPRVEDSGSCLTLHMQRMVGIRMSDTPAEQNTASTRLSDTHQGDDGACVCVYGCVCVLQLLFTWW